MKGESKGWVLIGSCIQHEFKEGMWDMDDVNRCIASPLCGCCVYVHAAHLPHIEFA